MGLDIGAPVGTPVRAPCNGTVHAFGYNPADGDYGHVVVTRHRLGETDFWLLFGHLSAESAAFKHRDAAVAAGEVVGWIGAPQENGGWAPHLHLQVALVEPATHDMPGVVSTSQHDQALRDYPDPRLIVGPLY